VGAGGRCQLGPRGRQPVANRRSERFEAVSLEGKRVVLVTPEERLTVLVAPVRYQDPDAVRDEVAVWAQEAGIRVVR
jgi:hypothetical protein